MFNRRNPPGSFRPPRDILAQIIAEVTAAIPPSADENLDGFLLDADHSFASHPSFAAAEVERTPDPASLLRVKLTLSDDVTSLQAVSTALREVWQSLVYNHFEASSITWYREATRLRFITVIENESFHVTGTAYALGAGYPNLVAAFERDFGSIHGPLPGVPGGLPAWAV